MIYSLNGKLILADASYAVIECAGVGYKCAVTANTLKELPQVYEKVMLYTYMNVREDAVDLFGFSTLDELNSFKLLVSVNGVGPKAALAVLSELSPSALALAVSSQDAKTITRAQGVGTKLAQRIVLELKDKLSIGSSNLENDVQTSVGNVHEEAVAALVTLGYSRSQAVSATEKLDSSLSVEEAVKLALTYLF